MDYNFKKYIKTYSTYKDLFGIKYDKSKLVKLIGSLSLNGTFDILSQPSFVSHTDTASNKQIADLYQTY